MRLILPVLLLASVGFADDLSKGLKAYQSADYEKAYELWKPLAKNGNAKAQYNLGIMYEKGIGVDQDYKEVVKWYELSAKQGNVEAQYSLGSMYANGRGIETNKVKAYKLWSSAAKQGHQSSKVNLNTLCKETPSACK